MKVRCTVNTEPDDLDPTITIQHALTVGGVYEVIGIEADWYRLLDDFGRPALFAPALFEVVDPARPTGWIVRQEDGAEYAYAPELAAPGFFEDYHDRKPEAVRAFYQYLNQRLRLTDVA